jgi:hypothetical protein
MLMQIEVVVKLKEIMERGTDGVSRSCFRKRSLGGVTRNTQEPSHYHLIRDSPGAGEVFAGGRNLLPGHEAGRS